MPLHRPLSAVRSVLSPRWGRRERRNRSGREWPAGSSCHPAPGSPRCRNRGRNSAEYSLEQPGALHRNVADTLVSEVLPLAEACRFLEREARWILAPQRLSAHGRPFWLAGLPRKPPASRWVSCS